MKREAQIGPTYCVKTTDFTFRGHDDEHAGTAPKTLISTTPSACYVSHIDIVYFTLHLLGCSCQQLIKLVRVGGFILKGDIDWFFPIEDNVRQTWKIL